MIWDGRVLLVPSKFSFLTFVSSSIAPASQNGLTYRFELGNIEPGEGGGRPQNTWQPPQTVGRTVYERNRDHRFIGSSTGCQPGGNLLPSAQACV